jgi:hypothetical protein
VDGPVAADDDEQVGTSGDGIPGQLDQVARTLREERFSREPALGRGVGDLRPAAPGGPVLGGRVDEEDRANE